MNYMLQDKSPASKSVGLGVVVVLHVALVYALMTGLGKAVIDVIRQPMEAKIFEDVKQPEAPPPPPRKTRIAPPPDWTLDWTVTPDFHVESERSAVTALSHAEPPADLQGPAAAAPTTDAVLRTPARIDIGEGCRRPDYPAAAKRAGESGTTSVSFLIGADGRVKESKIAKSSGSARLDEAARSALSLCKFVPATVNHQPVAGDSWTTIRYVWQLDDEAE